MTPLIRTSGKARASLFVALLSFGFAFLALATAFYPFLIGAFACAIITIALAVLAESDIGRSGGMLRGHGSVVTGTIFLVAGLGLGLLLPMT